MFDSDDLLDPNRPPPEGWEKEPNGLLGAVAPPEFCAEDFAAPKFPKRLLEFVAFASCGLLAPKSDPVAPPTPVLLGGGGPAGVVEANANPVLGLLAGVAFACPDAAPEPALPNKPPLPVLPAVPNKFGFWPALVVSAGLFGVEKPENPAEGPAFEELLVGP